MTKLDSRLRALESALWARGQAILDELFARGWLWRDAAGVYHGATAEDAAVAEHLNRLTAEHPGVVFPADLAYMWPC